MGAISNHSEDIGTFDKDADIKRKADELQLWERARLMEPQWIPSMGSVFALVVTPAERLILLSVLSPFAAHGNSKEEK